MDSHDHDDKELTAYLERLYNRGQHHPGQCALCMTEVRKPLRLPGDTRAIPLCPECFDEARGIHQ